MVVTYTWILYDSMVNQYKDTYKSFITTDAFSHEHLAQEYDRAIDIDNKTLIISDPNEFYLNDLNIMPVFEIKAFNNFYRKGIDIQRDHDKNFREGSIWDNTL